MSRPQLAAEAFHQDPAVLGAKRTLLEALGRHRAGLTAIRPPSPELATEYRATLEGFAERRGGSLFYPYLGSGLGSGALVELGDGSVKLDLIGGIGVHYFGHSHPRMTEALIDAALGDTVMQGNLQQNTESAELVASLIELAARGGAPLVHAFLSTSGATANENAMKIAFCERQPADRLLAFSGCFAGRTLALAHLTDNPSYRVGLPAALAVDYVPFFEPEEPAASTERCLQRLREHLRRQPGRHAAMVLELVQGEGGYYPGSREFFVAICELLREHDVRVWFDEIQTFGRSSQPFAFQHFELDEYAELVTIGKTSQVCATLFCAALRPPPGLVSQTFTGSSSAIAAARFVVREFRDGDLFGAEGRVARVSRHFHTGLEAIASRHPHWLRGPYGLGAMIAATPFDGAAPTTRALLDALYARGVIAFSTGGALSRLRFLPPVAAIRDEQIDTALALLEESLREVATP